MIPRTLGELRDALWLRKPFRLEAITEATKISVVQLREIYGTSINRFDICRIAQMRKLIPKNSEGCIVDIGGGLYPISYGLGFKKEVVVDGDAAFYPDIITDINDPLPIPNNTADVVVAGEIIEHLINPFRFLLEVRRILKPGGTLVLSTPNIVDVKSRIKVVFGRLPTACATPSASEVDHLFFHKSDFNLSKIVSLIEGAGLEITEKHSTGLFFREWLVVPPRFCPLTFGEKFIFVARKEAD